MYILSCLKFIIPLKVLKYLSFFSLSLSLCVTELNKQKINKNVSIRLCLKYRFILKVNYYYLFFLSFRITVFGVKTNFADFNTSAFYYNSINHELCVHAYE